MIARVGALRVRNAKIMIYLKTPSLMKCKLNREALNAYIDKENMKMVPQGCAPFLTEEINLLGDRSSKELL